MSETKKVQAGSSPALERQREYLDRVKVSTVGQETCAGLEIVVRPKVYSTSADTELMIESVEIGPEETFLEVGCGAGAISLSLARRAKSGLAVDINPDAVENTRENARLHQVANLEVSESDVFSEVDGRYDVIACNPPYSAHEVDDVYERMFWDPNDEMKLAFLKGAVEYLNPGGRIYFGWADFADIDVELPYRLAEQHGLSVRRTFSRRSNSGKYTFFVLELEPSSS